MPDSISATTETAADDTAAGTATVESSEATQDATDSGAKGDLSAADRSELDRLRAIHKEEKRWEKRAKENFADADKFRKLTDALSGGDKSDSFDPQDAIAKLRNEISAANLERDRADVARLKSVDPAFLAGSSRDEMESAADRYLADVDARVKAALVQQGKSPAVPSAESTTVVKGGDRVEGPRQITSEAELAKLSPADRMKAYNDGRLNKLMGL